MAAKTESEKRENWIYTAKGAREEIEKIAVGDWIKRVVIFLEKCNKFGKFPFFTGFWKDQGIWIYWLRDEINKGGYKDEKYKDFIQKYEVVKRIIKDGEVSDVISRNIDKASFASLFLQNEDYWSQEPQKTGNVQIVLHSYSPDYLPPTPEPQNRKLIQSHQLNNNILEQPTEPVGDVIIELKDDLKNILGEK